MLFSIVPVSSEKYVLVENFFVPENPLMLPPGTVRVRSCTADGQILVSSEGEESIEFSYDVIAASDGAILQGFVNKGLGVNNMSIEDLTQEVKTVVSTVVTPGFIDESHKFNMIENHIVSKRLVDEARSLSRYAMERYNSSVNHMNEHNWWEEMVERQEFLDTLKKAQQEGIMRSNDEN